MRVRTRFAGWVVGVLVACPLIGPTTAFAEERLRSGTMEATLAGGASISHTIQGKPSQTIQGRFEPLESVTGYQVLPHLGYVVTDEHGSDWLRGNFELLAEPMLVHLDAKSSSATVGGLAALGRWMFTGTGSVRPYLEAGAGVLGGQTDLPQTTCDLNFILEGGPGVMVFLSERTALSVGYRFQHISNGGKCTPNLGLNSSLVTVGVSYFFR